ncbi:MAG: hypothetical protein JRI22_14955 [Deltaproteobacteria bacterium]|nr:hypothetical protein [Deltaproteobacteria bacterium]
MAETLWQDTSGTARGFKPQCRHKRRAVIFRSAEKPRERSIGPSRCGGRKARLLFWQTLFQHGEDPERGAAGKKQGRILQSAPLGPLTLHCASHQGAGSQDLRFPAEEKRPVSLSSTQGDVS